MIAGQIISGLLSPWRALQTQGKAFPTTLSTQTRSRLKETSWVTIPQSLPSAIKFGPHGPIRLQKKPSSPEPEKPGLSCGWVRPTLISVIFLQLRAQRFWFTPERSEGFDILFRNVIDQPFHALKASKMDRDLSLRSRYGNRHPHRHLRLSLPALGRPVLSSQNAGEQNARILHPALRHAGAEQQFLSPAHHRGVRMLAGKHAQELCFRRKSQPV